MPKKCDPEVKARAVRMVREHLEDYGSATALRSRLVPSWGSRVSRCVRWVAQADIYDGAGPE